ncbi:hypothetical protein O7635_29525 [Asanoa sp. WMMD1127]|uniref:hypothetical protein n=1 Tax=Asanoa sp. WMMD1127 TaxID=3016107 RepID=UPI0024170D22|nr:hypothetical protein [Asanoa sp. WMMD1127]MDG4826010.1 hypothetical protein [Asanoa sp. WMMD1127]
MAAKDGATVKRGSYLHPGNMDPITESRRLRAGEVLSLRLEDYMYGSGPLLLEVESFGPLIDHPAVEWIGITGRKVSLFNNTRSLDRVTVDVRTAVIASRKVTTPPLTDARPVAGL